MTSENGTGSFPRRADMMAIKLPSDFENKTRNKLGKTASGKFFQYNTPKLVPSFDRGVLENDLVVGDGEIEMFEKQMIKSI